MTEQNTKSETPTPRSDAAMWQIDEGAEVVDYDFARTLERELNLLIKDRARFPDRPDSIGRLIEAHIANREGLLKMHEENWRQADMKCDALTSERDELRKDKERLDWYDNNYGAIYYGNAYHGRMGGWTVTVDNDEWPTIRQAIDAAIAKLNKPE